MWLCCDNARVWLQCARRAEHYCLKSKQLCVIRWLSTMTKQQSLLQLAASYGAPSRARRTALALMLPALATFGGCRVSFAELSAGDASDGSIAAADAVLSDASDAVRDGNADAAADASMQNAFAFSRRISFRNSTRPETFIDMPVMIRIDDTSQFANDGNDVRFFDANDQALAYEIENWGPRGGNVWVRVPRIEASSDASFITMRYGNPALPAGENPAAVWSAEFGLVMHFGKRGFVDSTGRNTAITMLNTSALPAGAVGFAGTGQARFTGSSYVAIADHPSLHGPNLTITAKVTHTSLPTSPNGWAMSMGRATGVSDANDFWLGRYQDNCRFGALGNVLNSSISCSNFSLSRNEAAVFRNTGGTGFTATFYLDATQAAQFTAASGNYNTARQVTLGADTVGAPTTPNDDYLTGSVDEFRIETVARSVHWLSAQAAMDAGTFAVYQ